MLFGGKAILLVLFTGFILIGCQSSVRFSSSKLPTRQHNKSESTDDKTVDYSRLSDARLKIVSKAESYIGTPYCYGGHESKCFDCSGFVKTVYEISDIVLPRISKDMYTEGKSVRLSDALPGDLVFFSDGKEINHVGIISGRNQMIHASTSQGVVRQSLDDKYFSSHLAGLKRYIK